MGNEQSSSSDSSSSAPVEPLLEPIAPDRSVLGGDTEIGFFNFAEGALQSLESLLGSRMALFPVVGIGKKKLTRCLFAIGLHYGPQFGHLSFLCVREVLLPLHWFPTTVFEHIVGHTNSCEALKLWMTGDKSIQRKLEGVRRLGAIFPMGSWRVPFELLVRFRNLNELTIGMPHYADHLSFISCTLPVKRFPGLTKLTIQSESFFEMVARSKVKLCDLLPELVEFHVRSRLAFLMGYGDNHKPEFKGDWFDMPTGLKTLCIEPTLKNESRQTFANADTRVGGALFTFWTLFNSKPPRWFERLPSSLEVLRVHLLLDLSYGYFDPRKFRWPASLRLLEIGYRYDSDSSKSWRRGGTEEPEYEEETFFVDRSKNSASKNSASKNSSSSTSTKPRMLWLNLPETLEELVLHSDIKKLPSAQVLPRMLRVLDVSRCYFPRLDSDAIRSDELLRLFQTLTSLEQFRAPLMDHAFQITSREEIRELRPTITAISIRVSKNLKLKEVAAQLPNLTELNVSGGSYGEPELKSIAKHFPKLTRLGSSYYPGIEPVYPPHLTEITTSSLTSAKPKYPAGLTSYSVAKLRSSRGLIGLPSTLTRLNIQEQNDSSLSGSNFHPKYLPPLLRFLSIGVWRGASDSTSILLWWSKLPASLPLESLEIRGRVSDELEKDTTFDSAKVLPFIHPTLTSLSLQLRDVRETLAQHIIDHLPHNLVSFSLCGPYDVFGQSKAIHVRPPLPQNSIRLLPPFLNEINTYLWPHDLIETWLKQARASRSQP